MIKEIYFRLVREKFTVVIQRYQSYSALERRLIAFAGSIFLAVIILYGIYIPAEAGLKGAEEAYASQAELLAWMQAKVPLAKESSAIQPSHQKTSLSTILSEKTKEYGVTLQRIELNKDNTAHVTLQNVPFNALMGWLNALAEEYGANVLSLTASKTEAAGEVDASIELSQ